MYYYAANCIIIDTLIYVASGRIICNGSVPQMPNWFFFTAVRALMLQPSWSSLHRIRWTLTWDRTNTHRLQLQRASKQIWEFFVMKNLHVDSSNSAINMIPAHLSPCDHAVRISGPDPSIPARMGMAWLQACTCTLYCTYLICQPNSPALLFFTSNAALLVVGAPI